MIDKTDFDSMRLEMKQFEANRENTITLSREIISLSKQLIHAVQRGDMANAEELDWQIKTNVKMLPAEHYEADIQHVAIQEFVEGSSFFTFAKTGKIPVKKEFSSSTEDYLCGICDLTGEMVRLAVNKVINKQYSEALAIKDAVAEIYGQFLRLDLRNGNLRKKADSIKWNLNKLEDIALSIALKQ